MNDESFKLERLKIGIAAPIEIRSLHDFLPTVTHFESSLGLGGTAVNLLVKGLLDLGHDVTIFTLDPRISEEYVIEGEKLKIVIGNFRSNWISKSLDFGSREARQIASQIKRHGEDIDIVNAHWSYEFAVGTILSKKKHLITFRDDALSILRMLKHPYRVTRVLTDFWVRKNGRNFSYNSEYLKALIKLPGVVIPNPADLPPDCGGIRTRLDAKKSVSICFIANGWDKRKNPYVALKAFRLLKAQVASNVELHLFGSGSELYGDNYNKAKSLGLTDGVTFHGKVKHADLMSVLDSFDIMLHTSIEESFGNNIIEAMVRGLPVVGGMKSGAVPWLLEFGKLGQLVDVTSPEAVKEGLLTLINNGELYENFSRLSSQRASLNFSRKNIANLYVKHYQEIIA